MSLCLSLKFNQIGEMQKLLRWCFSLSWRKKVVIRFQICTLWISIANESDFLKLDFVVYSFREIFSNKNYVFNTLHPAAFLATSIHPSSSRWRVELCRSVNLTVGLFSFSNSKKNLPKKSKSKFSWISKQLRDRLFWIFV